MMQDDGVAGTFQQNSRFDELLVGESEDEILENRQDAAAGQQGLEVADYVPNAEHVKDASVSVIAVGPYDEQSPFDFRNINDLLGKMPLESATYTALIYQGSDTEPDQATDPVGYMKWRLFEYVSMADGTVGIQRLQLDYDNARTDNEYLTYGPDEQHLTTGNVDMYVIPYTVPGTALSGELGVLAPYWPGGLDSVEQAAMQALDELQREAQPSGIPTRLDTEDGIDWDAVQASQQPSTTMPDVPYEINASSDLVRYIAANLLAGNTYIDVTDYANAAGTTEVADALFEACAQNPLIFNGNPTYQVTRRDGRMLLTVTSLTPWEQVNDQDVLNEQRQQVSDKADEIVADIITDGMSDADKVRAINDYIAENLWYNYDAISSGSFSMDAATQCPSTVRTLILDGGSICSGYAQTFKLLADRAGLESVYASGNVPPQPGVYATDHAWILVNIDGSWVVVDPTWNDPGDQSNTTSSDEYLMLAQDDPALQGLLVQLVVDGRHAALRLHRPKPALGLIEAPCLRTGKRASGVRDNRGGMSRVCRWVVAQQAVSCAARGSLGTMGLQEKPRQTLSKDLPMPMKDTIAAIRKEAGLTQEEMARRLYVTRQAISRWEQGTTEPGIDMLKLIARELDVPVTALLDMPEHYCQSCGMMFTAPGQHGHEADGSETEDFCRWCYDERRLHLRDHDGRDDRRLRAAHGRGDGLDCGRGGVASGRGAADASPLA